jgi:ubiquinone/menaquinone biosynthesis C-methylase UbiE
VGLAEIAIKKFHRLLKTGGKICILDTTADSWIIKVMDRIIEKTGFYHIQDKL